MSKCPCLLTVCADALDDITDLQDPDLFYAIIEQEIQARAPQTEKDKDTIDAARNPSFVAKLVGDRFVIDYRRLSDPYYLFTEFTMHIYLHLAGDSCVTLSSDLRLRVCETTMW